MLPCVGFRSAILYAGALSAFIVGVMVDLLEPGVGVSLMLWGNFMLLLGIRLDRS
jgi:hypothetical protein